jgi:hypothetical protein
MNGADRGIRWSTALAVVGVEAVAAVVPYEHASVLYLAPDGGGISRSLQILRASAKSISR